MSVGSCCWPGQLQESCSPLGLAMCAFEGHAAFSSTFYPVFHRTIRSSCRRSSRGGRTDVRWAAVSEESDQKMTKKIDIKERVSALDESRYFTNKIHAACRYTEGFEPVNFMLVHSRSRDTKPALTKRASNTTSPATVQKQPLFIPTYAVPAGGCSTAA